MSTLLALLAVIGGVALWIWRITIAVQTARQLHQDTKGLQRHARTTANSILGTKLQRLQDTRVAATVLMLQLLRAGSHVTAAEKTQIMELMEHPLGIANVEQTFVRAWSLTEQGRSLASVGDELLPLLHANLTRGECFELIDMLKRVANAYGEASDLQLEAIDRFRRELTGPAAGRS